MDELLYDEMFRVEAEHWWFQAKHRIVSHLLARYVPESRARVADLGCGCGMLIARLNERYDIVGLDGSEHAARFAAKRGIRIEVGQLPGPTSFLDQSFDAVMLLDVLEHLDDDVGTVTEASRLLKIGGYLIATVPAHPWLWTRRDEMHHHRRRYTRNAFRRLVDRPEFEQITVTYINSVLFPIALAERFYRKLRPISDTGDLSIPPTPVNALLRESFAMERHLLGTVRLPMGLSLLAVVRKQQ